MREKISFDFDGVIVDTAFIKKDWFINNLGINLEKLDKSSIYNELSNMYSIEEIDKIYTNMSKEIFTENNLLNTNLININIKKNLEKLSEEYDLYILSNRPLYMKGWIIKYLKKHDLNDCFIDILSSANGNKQDICLEKGINTLIDDDKRHLMENKIDNRIYFESWEQVLEELKVDRKIITFFGLPGSGKSTYMENFKDYKKIIAAQLLIDKGYDVKKGYLISDDIVIDLMIDKIKKTKGNIILDGFPRTVKQLETLYEKGIKINEVYNVITPYDEVLKRIEDRLTCPNCHESYTISDYKKPLIPMVCNTCKSKLIKREDDELELYKIRIKTFFDKTYPLLDEYKKKNIDVIDVDGLTYNKCNKKKEYIGVIWNTMNDYKEDVLNDLENEVDICSYIDVELPELEDFIWDVYGDNNQIVKERVKRKIDNTVYLNESRYIRILFLETDKDIRSIKQNIRKKYKDKVNHYDYDNIFHLTENYYENIRVLEAIKKYIYIKEKVKKI